MPFTPDNQEEETRGSFIPDERPDLSHMMEGLDIPSDYAAVPKVAKPKSLLSKAWDFANKPLLDIGHKVASTISEPLMSYGEQSNDLVHKAASYGGAFTQGVGDALDSLTSPLNAGLLALSGGSSAAARYGLPELSKSLEIPAKIADYGMVGHGGYKALDSEETPENRLSGVLEAVLGGFGAASKGRLPEESVRPEVKDAISEIPPVTKLERSSVKSPIADEQNIRINPKTGQKFIGDSPKRLIRDDAGRVIAEEPITAKPVDVLENGQSGFIPDEVVEKPIPPPLDIRPEGDVTVRGNAIKKRLSSDEVISPISEQSSFIPDGVSDPRITSEVPQTEAKFNSWQVDPTHPEGGYALYDIPTEKGPTTVSADTLKIQGIEIPETPPMPKGDAKPIPQPVKDMLLKSGMDEAKINSLGFDEAINQARTIQRGGVSDLRKEVPITPVTEAVRNPVESIDRLKNAIQKSAEVRGQQETMNLAERKSRAAALESVKTTGLAGYREQLAKLKGEFNKVPVEHQLGQQDVDSLMDAITNSELRTYDKLSTKKALYNLSMGKTIRPFESKLLGKVFGDDLDQLIHLNGGIGVPLNDMISEGVNLPKSIMSSVDLSAPLRQGLGLIHTSQYWKAIPEMFKSAFSESHFNDFQKSLTERPTFTLGDENGLYLAGMDQGLHGREEAFLSKVVDKIPGVGQLVRGSERGYVSFLNKLRADTFDSIVSDVQKGTGIRPEESAKAIARVVNNSTGRGTLGSLEKSANELNNILFSPRLISSRLTMLNPKYYTDLPPYARKEALKSLFAIAAAGTTISQLLKLAGAKVDYNPTSSDFGKAQFGRSRVDPYGGLQQYIIAASRLISGKQTSVSGRDYDLNQGKFPNPTRLTVLSNLARSKESPIASFVDEVLTGSAQSFAPGGLGGQIGKNRVSAEVINRFTPMLMGDMIDLAKSDPNLLPLSALGVFGAGVQTMDEPKAKSAFRMNQIFR